MKCLTLPAVLFLSLVSCDWRSSAAGVTTQADQKQDPAVSEAAHWISAGECDRGEQVLKSSPARDAAWYELMSQLHMCRWRKAHSEAERSAAIAVLDEGVRVFPKNANLLLSKAYRYQEFGDTAHATEFFNEAESMTEFGPDSGSIAATEIIEASERGKRELKPRSDLSPGLAIERGAELSNEGRCVEAAKILDGVAASERVHRWYVARLNAADCCGMMKSSQSGCWEDAERTLAAGLKEYPKSIDLVSAGAFFEERAGKRAEAIQHFTLLLDLCKDDAPKCQPPFSPGEIRLHLKQLGAQ
jgi:tetratricopeptide (TPR) repeat protein